MPAFLFFLLLSMSVAVGVSFASAAGAAADEAGNGLGNGAGNAAGAQAGPAARAEAASVLKPARLPPVVMKHSRQLEMRLMQEAAQDQQRVQALRRQDRIKKTVVETEIRRLSTGNTFANTSARPGVPAQTTRMPASAAPVAPSDASSIYNASEPVAPRSAPVAR